MREWALLLGGLTVWAAHFFTLYAIASILPGKPDARLLVLWVTVPALLLNLLILKVAWQHASTSSADDAEPLMAKAGAAGALLSLVAVSWQALPAIAA